MENLKQIYKTLFLVMAVSSCANNAKLNMEMEQGGEERNIALSPISTALQNMDLTSSPASASVHPQTTTNVNNAEAPLNTLLQEENLRSHVREYLSFSEAAKLECASKQFDKATYPTIKTLELSPYARNKFERLEGAKLAKFITRYPSIKQLDLSRCHNLIGTDLAAILQECKQIEELNLSDCHNLTDAGIQAIAQHFQELKSLYLEECPGIEGNGIRSIAQMCRELAICSMVNCHAIKHNHILESQYAARPRTRFLMTCD